MPDIYYDFLPEILTHSGLSKLALKTRDKSGFNEGQGARLLHNRERSIYKSILLLYYSVYLKINMLFLRI